MQPVKAILFEPHCLADAQGTYEDVEPAFAELRAMGIQLDIGFVSVEALESAPFFLSRDCKGAVRTPFQQPVTPAQTMYVTDNAEGLAKAKAAGMIPILLMHNPDEAMRLVANKPAGGIVSLLELPDFIRFVTATSPLPSPLPSGP